MNRSALGADIHNVLQCVAMCCSVLQCVAVCCSVLRCVAVCYSVLHSAADAAQPEDSSHLCCSMLQHVAACCSVLQCITVCRSVVHHCCQARTELSVKHKKEALSIQLERHLSLPPRVWVPCQWGPFRNIQSLLELFYELSESAQTLLKNSVSRHTLAVGVRQIRILTIPLSIKWRLGGLSGEFEKRFRKRVRNTYKAFYQNLDQSSPLLVLNSPAKSLPKLSTKATSI